MPDTPDTSCWRCDGARTIPRLYDNGHDHRGPARIRAAAHVPCPVCTNSRQIETTEARC